MAELLREKPNVKWRFISWRIPVEVTRLLLLIPYVGDTKRARLGVCVCVVVGGGARIWDPVRFTRSLETLCLSAVSRSVLSRDVHNDVLKREDLHVEN